MSTRAITRWTVIGLILVAFGCGGSKPDAATAAPPETATPGATGSASVTGTVTFSGVAPVAAAIKMDADPACALHASSHAAEEVIVTDGKLANVFVYVKEGVTGSYPAPTTPVTIDQQGCWYLPHVLGIQINQPLEILNSDATLHNINVKPATNQPFNIAQPTKGMKTTKKFTKREVMIKTKCNVHPWMSAYIGVLDHPFFGVTGADGGFTLANLPAGTYTVAAWHEKFGEKTQSVTIADGASATVTFAFP